MSDKKWAELHNFYRKADWISKPSIFAEVVKEYLPANGEILDLGAGLGQDSLYFANHGYNVTSTDLKSDSLEKIASSKIAVKQVDLREPLPFDDGIFDVVYAHLSLHYFEGQVTKQIFAEIHRVLKSNGILAFFTNSTEDPEYNTGQKIEEDYFEIDGVFKRYLSVESARKFAQDFEPLLLDNKGETYKDAAQGIHNLIRFIGKKPN